MILAVNIGNTNTLAGFWKDGRIRQISTLTANLCSSAGYLHFLEDQLKALGETPGDITGSIMVSVVPDKTRFVFEAVEGLTGMPPQIADITSGMGIDLSAYDSNLLGADRVVCCVSAMAKYPPPLVVFDLGTATTANVVDADGSFVGGAILPGVGLGLEALASGTSLLPRLDLGTDVPVIGRSTRQCLASGALNGTAFFMEGFSQRVEAELGQKVTMVVTGGNAACVIPHCRVELHHEPTLLLEGLVLLYLEHLSNRKGDQHAIKQ